MRKLLLTMSMVGAAFAGIAALSTAVTAGDEEHVEKKKVRKVIRTHGDHDGHGHGEHSWVMIGDEDAEKIDLSELGDGDSRTYGTGEDVFSVTREGNTVTLVRMNSDKDPIELDCPMEPKVCTMIVPEDGPAKIMVTKTAICENGEGDCDDVGHEAWIGKLPEGSKSVFISKEMDCDSEEDCVAEVKILGDGAEHMIHEAHGNTFVIKTDCEDGEGECEDVRVITKGSGDASGTWISDDLVTHDLKGKKFKFMAGGEKSAEVVCPDGEEPKLESEKDGVRTMLCPTSGAKIKIKTVNKSKMVIKDEEHEDED